MAAIDSAYHYYLSVYGNSASTRYDTHKKSELRNVYNSILKINKESPLYKIKSDGDMHRFIIDIKESSRNIKNVVASLSVYNGGLESVFQKKVAVSSNDDIVSAEYVGDSGEASSPNFDIEVKQLAAPQTNLGKYLKENEFNIKPGDYSFDLTTTSASYEFQYSVNPEDSNRSVQEKISTLVNGSGVGIHADIVTDEANRSALKLTSKQTGLSENESFLFDINPDASAESMAAMDVLGINRITTPAENSYFILNGVPHSSFANTFTVNKTFELTLNGLSEKENPTNIGFKTNIETVADNLQGLVNAYNGFVRIGANYSSSGQGAKLLSDLKQVTNSNQNELEAIGLVSDDEGSISLDRKLLADAVDMEDPSETFSVLNAFKNSLYTKANNASLDPMQYVDKIVVTYKNPGRNFFSPYYSSIYSGMMLDYYY